MAASQHVWPCAASRGEALAGFRIPKGIAWLIGAGYLAYYRTLDVTLHLPDGSTLRPGQWRDVRSIFVMCERDTLAIAGAMSALGVTALVAPGRDGDWVSTALEVIHFKIVRGSTLHRAAPALMNLVKRLKASPGPAVIVADGPLGPDGHVRAGAFFCAMKAGRPVVGLAAAAARARVFRGTWAQMYLPFPFTRIAIVAS